MNRFPLHAGLTIATVAVVLSAARLAAPLMQFAAIVEFSPKHVPMSPLARHPEPEPEPVAALNRAPIQPVLLADSTAELDRFYEALWRTEKQEAGAVTRILHYGDSPTTADLITGDLRSMLQERFGNAGHGFILIAKPWAWYQHSGADVDGSGWQMTPASRFESHDGLFGLGGVSFAGGVGARSRIAFRVKGQSSVEIWFLCQPGGGTFSASANGQVLGIVDTAGDSKASAFVTYEVPEGVRELELRVDRGSVRLFGVVAEKPGHGVVYDSLGLNGASITVLTRMFNEAQWAEGLRHRGPNLVIINYGTNEADFASFVDGPYEKELRAAIGRLRRALPESSILVMSPMDRGEHTSQGIATMPTIPRIVAIQKRVARETGCGFFDTFSAMGGEGTMARWYAAQPRLVSADLIHPYPAGGKKIAAIIASEIQNGLNRYKIHATVR